MNISLVLTTCNRFESFLKNNIDKYLQNRYIHEIVVLDDCSADYDKLMTAYTDHPKVKVHKQPKNVGAYHNKIDAMNLASPECDWICLMDSDNFCTPSYFEALFACWEKRGSDPNVIYCPVRAGPFDFRKWNDQTISKVNWNDAYTDILANTGNYVFHRSIVPIMNQHRATHSQVQPHAADAIYMNYVWVKSGCSLHVVPGMEYEHVVHPGSTYLNTQKESESFASSFDWKLS